MGMTIIDPARIDAFLGRGIEHVFPNLDFVRAKMLRGERLTMYHGIDPTGPTLHLGHVITLRKLREFQQLGHQVILLIGDMTAMIGDPTDKADARKQLTHKEVLANAKLYKKQASTFLSFSGRNKAVLKYNSKWLKKMRFTDVLELASKVTVEQMIKRDMFARRTEEGKPIFIHEFMYPLMQGYDSVAMDVDGEIGGNDQTFNMLIGRDLIKSMKSKEKFVISLRLLTDSSGKKMGKTENNAVFLNQSANEMFGKVMSWPDGMIIPGFELLTDMPVAQISAANPREDKARLAQEITAMIHGKEAAAEARIHFENTFKKREIPTDTKEVSVLSGAPLVDVLLAEGLVASKGEFRRLIEGKGVNEVAVDGIETLIDSAEYKITKNISVRIGKRRFLKVLVR